MLELTGISSAWIDEIEIVGRPSLKVNIGSWCHEHRFIELRTYVQEATNIGWCKDDVRNASVHSDGTGDS